ncbi:MAG: hypothetical protein J0L92_32040 [Deltaproteobacteria bacterium]|nr:hypothetical protein [Deltaproteobacteria bacterium]
MRRRDLVSSVTLSVLGALALERTFTREVALARCASISLATEIELSRYVIEVNVLRVDAHAALLDVRASWKGSPPDTLTVSFSGRSHPLRRGAADTIHLVFARGASDTRLTLYPCGASGILDASMIDALRAAGLTRRAIG